MDIEQYASDSIYSIGKRINFNQSLQPEGKLVVDRKESAG